MHFRHFSRPPAPGAERFSITAGLAGRRELKPQDKDRVVVEVVQRVLDRWAADPASAEAALFETIYHERRRLEGERDRKQAHRQAAFYDRLYKEALHGNGSRYRQMLKQVLENFTREVVGHFDERVYQLATRVVPTGLSFLLNTVSPLRMLETLQGSSGLVDQLVIEGETDALHRLIELGTVILVPTHSSNLDSILLGFALHRLGLPPFTYGAGLNLFHNKLIGFFMHNLGAYKVDRRKKAPVYKDVLKTYAGYSMELGYHNLFFPGGTRSRSGAVEHKLKMGLLGMGLDATIRNLQARRDKPDIFVVPCTLNYQLVLEAETLIDDHLKETGKSRYIIEDDEFSRPRRIYEWIKQIFSLHSTIHLVVGQPLDVFGNRVDENGRSLDFRGRPVERARYVLDASGRPGFQPQRDREYTRELAGAIVRSFRRNTVLRPIQLVSAAVFDLLRARNPEMDLYRLLRLGGRDESLPLPDTYQQIDQLLQRVRRRAREGSFKIDETLARGDVVAVLSAALSHLAVYHSKPALERRGDRLFHHNRSLLLYYGNRLHSVMDGDGGRS